MVVFAATISASSSDFNKIGVTALKNFIRKGNPRSISYQNYRNLDGSLFKSTLNETLKKIIRDREQWL